MHVIFIKNNVTNITQLRTQHIRTRGRMHDADVSASLRLKLTYDGLAH